RRLAAAAAASALLGVATPASAASQPAPTSPRDRATDQQGTAAVSELPGLVLMSDYPGADDTARMRAALSAVAAMSPGRRPAILVPPGTMWNTGTSPFQLFDGCQIIG